MCAQPSPGLLATSFVRTRLWLCPISLLGGCLRGCRRRLRFAVPVSLVSWAPWLRPQLGEGERDLCKQPVAKGLDRRTPLLAAGAHEVVGASRQGQLGSKWRDQTSQGNVVRSDQLVAEHDAPPSLAASRAWSATLRRRP